MKLQHARNVMLVRLEEGGADWAVVHIWLLRSCTLYSACDVTSLIMNDKTSCLWTIVVPKFQEVSFYTNNVNFSHSMCII